MIETFRPNENFINQGKANQKIRGTQISLKERQENQEKMQRGEGNYCGIKIKIETKKKTQIEL